MAGTRLDEIRRDLEHEKDIAEAEVGRLKEELAAAEKDAKAIKDALTALGRKPGTAVKKPALKKADAIKAVKAYLTKAGKPVSQDEIEAMLTEFAAKNGKSATGLKLRLKEALTEPLFAVDSNTVSLAETVAAG